MDQAGTNREAVMVEAADWLARLDAAGQDRSLHEAFALWKDEAPAHALAVARLRHAWDLAGQVSVLAFPANPATARVPAPGRRRRVGWLQGGIAASLIVVAGAALAIAGSGASYATGVGERRLVQLGANASVELNTDTRIRVRRRHGMPVLELQRGEVLVKAPRMEVTADGQRLVAQDASFDVRLGPGGVEVAALDGAVTAWPAPQRRLLVRTGQIASLQGTAVRSLSTAPGEIQRRLAWREGRLDFNGQTLGEIAAEFNRYNRLELTVAPSAAALRVGGVFDAQAPAAFARSTAGAFGLQVQPTADGLRLAAAPRPSA